MEKLEAIPLELKEANAFVEKLHRHHDPVKRDKFRFGCASNGEIVGVIQIGRSLSRKLCDGKTLEVLRLCTDGTYNVCSFLYSKAARIAKEMGYKKIITYILKTEDGASLKASGWHLEDGDCGGGTWDVQSRRRYLIDGQYSIFEKRQKYPTEKKQRWAKEL